MPAPTDKVAALALMPVSRETLTRLEAYVDLLLQWQAGTYLVAPSTLPTLWPLHIADSLQLLGLAPDARTLADLGSGGGFPGIVLACALADRPGVRIDLVERNAKKADYLREAPRPPGGAGEVHHKDIVDYVYSRETPVEFVTARALAPRHQLLGFAEPLGRNGAKALFLKCQDIE